jgi:PTH1 family peptidyl-tRNA hydrolase
MKNTNLDKIFEALRGLTSRRESQTPQFVDPTGETFLIVGLGNPGRDLEFTRHNIGFMVVNQLADRLNLNFSRSQSKALITDGYFQGHKIILVKPHTYMNKSGHPTRALINFYKISLENLLVVYDDVDLPFDTVRLKPSGGSAGHKGIKSIIEQLGTSDFPRLRLGVGRPPGYKNAANYVLKPFNKDEREYLKSYLERAADAVEKFVSHGIDFAMTNYN